MLTGGGGIVGRFVHAEDVPVIIGFAAEHHAAAGGVNGGGFDGVVVETPNDVADGALIVHDHGKMRVRDEVKILLAQMVGGLFAAAEFAGGRAKDEIGIEAGGEFVSVGVVEGFGAGVHGFFHFGDERFFGGTGLCDGEPSDAALEVNRDAEAFEKVHAEDAIEWAAAGFGDCGEIDGGKADCAKSVIAEGKFIDGNFARFQRRDFVPGLHADLGSVALREGFLVEHGGGGGVDQEALVLLVYLQDDDGEAIAVLERNFVAGR